MEASWLELHRRGELKRRAETAVRVLTECRLCPRSCGRNRWLTSGAGAGPAGRPGRQLPCPLRGGVAAGGDGGSGTIFISSCNLLCTFCQNDDISHGRMGDDVEPAHLATMMLSLQERGCPKSTS
jgi:putative pyruvate formate lyase activating enzyme